VKQETKKKIFRAWEFRAWVATSCDKKQTAASAPKCRIYSVDKQGAQDTKPKQVARRTLTRIGELAAHPAAFGILLVYATLWFMFDRKSLDWHAFATLATWFMTLIIQRAEDRDTQALQAKLDELLRVSRSADSDLAKIDNLEPEDIKQIRNEA
jgi:low affinity Fe/Cu permease